MTTLTANDISNVIRPKIVSLSPEQKEFLVRLKGALDYRYKECDRGEHKKPDEENKRCYYCYRHLVFNMSQINKDNLALATRFHPDDPSMIASLVKKLDSEYIERRQKLDQRDGIYAIMRELEEYSKKGL